MPIYSAMSERVKILLLVYCIPFLTPQVIMEISSTKTDEKGRTHFHTIKNMRPASMHPSS